MTTSETGLAQFIKSVRAFCSDLAGLLATAERTMTDEGWEGAADNQCWGDKVSFSVNGPKAWFPYELFRFFKNDQASHVLALITVVLEGRGEKEAYSPWLVLP